MHLFCLMYNLILSLMKLTVNGITKICGLFARFVLQ